MPAITWLLTGVLLLHSSECVVNPLEKLSEDVKTLQETLASIQGSLMTSVGLIQDQVTEVTERMTGQLESKLISLDKRLEVVNNGLNNVKERAGQWESLQPHLQILSTRTTEIEQKLDHFSRTHSDQLSEHQRTTQFRMEGINRKLEELGSQTQVLDTRLINVQEKVELLPVIQTDIRNTTARNNVRHRSQQCQETKVAMENTRELVEGTRDLVEGMHNKVDIIIDKVLGDRSNGPTFEYLRSDPAPQGGSSQHVVVEKEELEASEDARLAGLIRKIVVPYKRANKRLKEVEEEQGRIEEILLRMEDRFGVSLEDLTRHFADFKISYTDMFQEQTQTIEGYGKSLAAVLQCCQGQSVDYNRFVASTSPVMERLDAWMVSWRSEVNQALQRIKHQDSYGLEKMENQLKELEKLIIESIDNRSGRILTRSQGSVSTTSTTTTSMITTTTAAAAAPTKSSLVTFEINSQPDDDFGETFMDCMDLVKAGKYESKVYRLGPERDINAVGRDFYTRRCDLHTNGGGWTIIQHRGDYGEPKVNFTATWEDYKLGFGDLQGEFWFGNDHLARLTAERAYTLRVNLESWDGRTAFAQYDLFRVDSEDSDYAVWVGGYSGNASDSLTVHNGSKFSTIDRNNDKAPPCCPCAPAYGGGWWFYSCFESNLNGDYFTNPLDNGYYRGIIWELWLGDYSLKSSTMMIRPRDTDGSPVLVPDP